MPHYKAWTDFKENSGAVEVLSKSTAHAIDFTA